MNDVKNPIFVFDLHDVLVKKNYRAMLLLIMKNLLDPRLMATLIRPFCFLKIIRLLCTSRVPEQYIVQLSQHYPYLAQYLPITVTIMNQQVPIDDTIQIAHTLKSKGYPLYLFSNIGEETFRVFKKLFPEIVTIFDDICITESSDNWIQKPHTASFKKFVSQCSVAPSDCIFIDNNKNNIRSARNYGFHTILYKGSHQLKSALKQFITDSAKQE